MKRILVLILSILTPALITAQEPVDVDELIYQKKKYYYNGHLFTGMMTGRDDVQDMPYIVTIINGVANGVKTWYFDDEMTHINSVVPVVNGMQNGLYIGYTKNGKISFTVERKKNVSHGKRHCYTEEGMLWHTHTYRKGKENGVRTTFCTITGRVQNKVNYRNDVMHGKDISYDFDSEKVRLKGRYKNGKKHGKWHSYERGKLILVGKYKEGELQ